MGKLATDVLDGVMDSFAEERAEYQEAIHQRDEMLWRAAAVMRDVIEGDGAMARRCADWVRDFDELERACGE